MDKYISRKAVIELVMQYCPDDDGSCSKADVDLREMLDELESLSPVVPQEMSAREYGETLMKICASHTGECWKCELGKNKPCAIPYKRTIPIVEKWAKEHPEGGAE